MQTFALDPQDNRVHIDSTASNTDYFCPICGAQLIPKKGDIRCHHFAHKGESACKDTWTQTYNDSAWHKTWQERYPKQNREITLTLGDIKHRADVLTGKTVIEFQKSSLSIDSFADRNAFYSDLGYKVIWLFDLRELYETGQIAEDANEGSQSFTWNNPKKAFRLHDIKHDNVSLFFQLKDDEGEPCIVRPTSVSKSGFEIYSANWLTAGKFLVETGLLNDTCPPPELNTLEPNEDYFRFKEHFSIQLNRQQERAVQTVDGATLLLAVPGSGKTTTLITRLGYLTLERNIPPEEIIAITYTRAAATEMRERFAQKFNDPQLANRISFSTINKLAQDIYRDDCRLRGVTPRRVEQNRIRAILRKTYKNVNRRPATELELIEIENAINYAKNMMLDDKEINSISEDIEHFDEIYASYQRELECNSLIDFDDQLTLAFEALRNNRNLRQSWCSRFKYWNVDEAQDTSRIQHNIIYYLVCRNGNLFMVGDEDQSIFGFRGAYPKALLNFKYVYSNAFVLKIEQNYRSGKEIVSSAQTFISKNKGRIAKDMTAARDSGARITTLKVTRRRDQWSAVYDLIKEHRGEIAVLYRENDVAIPLIDRLLRDDKQFMLLKGKKTFFDSPVASDIRAFFALSLNPWDKDAFSRIYFKCGEIIKRNDFDWVMKMYRKSGPDLLTLLENQMSNYRKRWQKELDSEKAWRISRLIRPLKDMPPAKAIDSLLRGGYGDFLREQGRPTYQVDILWDIAQRESTPEGFLARLDQLKNEIDRLEGQAYRGGPILSSVHSSKGREFDTVVIMDAVDGTFPSSRPNIFDQSKDSADSYQEERRLFYVAITRARDELILVKPLREKTPFVDEVARGIEKATSSK